MRDALVVSVGTGPKRVVRFLKRRARKGLKKTEFGSLQILSYDVDGTGGFGELSEAASGDAFEAGEFHRLDIPGHDTIESITVGRRRGAYELVNPEAVRVSEGIKDGTGGAKANGWLASKSHSGKIAQDIENRFQRVIQIRRVQARPEESRVVVMVVWGGFGGFGSGAKDVVVDIVLQVAYAMKLDVDVQCLALVPGTNLGKDAENSDAIAFGALREHAAHSTKRYSVRAERAGRTVVIKRVYVPTYLLTDTNRAPRQPKALTIENFFRFAAEFLYTLVAGPLGERIDALIGDFAERSSELSEAGEPRFGRSAGLASIFLDRERIQLYTSIRLTERVVARILQNVPEDRIREGVRGLFELLGIVEGAGARQLSTGLLGGRIERVRRLSRTNLGELRGIDLLQRAPAHVSLAAAQAGDLHADLARRSADLVGRFRDEVNRRRNTMAADPEAGFAVAAQFLQEVAAVGRNMQNQTARDTGVLEARSVQLQRQVEHTEREYLPAVLRKNVIYKWWRKDRIHANAEEYCRALEEREAVRARLAAHQAALSVLQQITEEAEARLVETQSRIAALTDFQTWLRSKRQEVAAQPSDIDCPIGLPLIASLDDLESTYVRLVPDEAADLRRLHGGLFSPEEPLLERTRHQLESAAEEATRTILSERIEALHVVDEVRRRFPDAEAFGKVLRERSARESWEYIQLKDSSDAENGIFVIRLLGIDAARLGDIPDVLGRVDITRTTPFEVVDTGDPERIVFLQVRAVFPLSDLAHFARFRTAYEKASRSILFEKYDVVPGNRFLPVNGDVLTEENTRIVAVKGYLLDRLAYDKKQQTWVLDPADGTDAPLAIGAHLEALARKEGYRCAVDVGSSFSCLYLEKGPGYIRARLEHLTAVRAKKQKATSELERRVSALLTEGVLARVEEELQWWAKNTIPAAMVWGAQARDHRLLAFAR